MADDTTPTSWRAPMPNLVHRARMFAVVEIVPVCLAVGGLCVVAGDGVWALDVVLFITMYVLTMLGVELGMHRVIAHRQLDAAPSVRAALCIFGAMAGEGSPLLWSAIHRLHHASPDGGADPHSPTFNRVGLASRVRGALWSQFLWYADIPGILGFRRALRARMERRTRTPDAQAEGFVDIVRDWLDDDLTTWIERRYSLWIGLGFALPAALGAVSGGLDGGLHGLVWGGFVRHVAVQQVSFAVNSVGHTLGARSLATSDQSRNNIVMAILTLGAGWHNNHHAFPGAASLSFRWWQLDPCGMVIRALEAIGLATNVHRADPARLATRENR